MAITSDLDPMIDGQVLALAGGVGGAKLVLGLSRLLPPDQLVIVVNTGDDECFHGLHVSPDLDTVMYTLAGLADPEKGWGLTGETFNALEMLGRYGADTWFNLGDRDLATHIRRTQLLHQGATLSEATAELCQRLGIAHRIVPMSDEPVRTMLDTEDGELPMQQYFVKQLAEPKVRGVRIPLTGISGRSGSGQAGGLLPIQPIPQSRPNTGHPWRAGIVEGFHRP